MNSGSRAPQITLFFREAWRNFRAAPALTFVATLTIAVSLILVGLFSFVMVHADDLLGNMARDLQITVYLESDVTESEITPIMKRLENREEVRKATFLTQDEDRARNIALLSPELLEGLDEGAIPSQPAIDLQLVERERTKADFEKIELWLKDFAAVDGVQELYFGADKIRVLFAVIDMVRVTGMIICLIVLAAAIFFTFSIIKLAVYARQDEIEILRLVGATNRFIRAPFYIEGAAAGLMGSISAMLIVGFIQNRLLAFAEEEHFMNVNFELMPASMIVWLLIGGVGLGLLGSALSVSRYLRI